MVVEQEGVIGTYVHGFLDNRAVIDYLLHNTNPSQPKAESLASFKEEQYNRLAEHVRRHVDIPKLYEIMSHD